MQHVCAAADFPWSTVLDAVAAVAAADVGVAAAAAAAGGTGDESCPLHMCFVLIHHNLKENYMSILAPKRTPIGYQLDIIPTSTRRFERFEKRHTLFIDIPVFNVQFC